MKERYLIIYLRFLVLLGALLLGGLVLVSITGAQSRLSDPIVRELQRQDFNREQTRIHLNRQKAIRATYGDPNSPEHKAKLAKFREEQQEKARAQMVQVPTRLPEEVRGTTVSPPKTVTVVLDVHGYNGALQHAIAGELTDLSAMVGGFFEVHSLNRDAEGTWSVTFLWEPRN